MTTDTLVCLSDDPVCLSNTDLKNWGGSVENRGDRDDGDGGRLEEKNE